jgi:caffeoyl-CoA O-methyltransferase
MSNRTTLLVEPLYDYFLANSLREPEVLARLRAETAKLPMANMQIAPEQGQFMGFLIELMGAKRSIEIGTFTGYSALWVALSMPPEGRVIACDINAEWTAIGRRYWAEAGVADKIDLRLAPAKETLDTLIAQGEAGRFDFAFIDADKTGYEGYYERVLTLLRPGGMVAVDNVLWDGRVADPREKDKDTQAIRAFNAKLHGDPRVTISLVPIGDGLTLARKRG